MNKTTRSIALYGIVCAAYLLCYGLVIARLRPAKLPQIPLPNDYYVVPLKPGEHKGAINRNILRDAEQRHLKLAIPEGVYYLSGENSMVEFGLGVHALVMPLHSKVIFKDVLENNASFPYLVGLPPPGQSGCISYWTLQPDDDGHAEVSAHDGYATVRTEPLVHYDENGYARLK
jgi:hypothetical protein